MSNYNCTLVQCSQGHIIVYCCYNMFIFLCFYFVLCTHFLHRVVRKPIWNSLPDNVVSAESVNSIVLSRDWINFGLCMTLYMTRASPWDIYGTYSKPWRSINKRYILILHRPQSRRRKPPWNVLSHKPPQNF